MLALDGQGLTHDQFCYHLAAPLGSGVPPLDACADVSPVPGVHLTRFAHVWGGVAYQLTVTRNADGWRPLPGEDTRTAGPFDLTTVANTTTVNVTDRGLKVTLTDGPFNPVGGACWELEDDVRFAAIRCDSADGALDGSTSFPGVPDGLYRLRETTIPANSIRVGTRQVSSPSDVTIDGASYCTVCVSVQLVNQHHDAVSDGCVAASATVRFNDGFGGFSDVPGDLGPVCSDLDGLISFGFDWPVVSDVTLNVQRSGVAVGSPHFTLGAGYHQFDVTVPDPARLVVHGVGEDGQPLPAPFDCGAPVLFARSDCVFEGVVGTQVQVGLPAAAGYVAPAGFTWTLSSLTDTRTVQWPRAQVTVHRVGASGRYCVVLTDTASVAAGDFQCSNATGGDIVLRAMSAGTYTLAEVSAPPGHQVAGAVTVTLVDGQAVNVDLVEHTALTVRLDDYFSAVPGGCFQLEASDHTLYGRCDGDDGANDGATGFVNVPDGSYRLRETTVPSGHVRIASRPVTVPGDVTVDGRKCTACLSVRMLDLNHNPISDACMNLAPGVDTIAGIPGGGDHVERPVGCEDLDGLISFGYQDFSYLSPGSPGFPATWPVVVRRSGVVVAANASVTLTPGSAIQELMVPDPVFPDLTVHLKGQSGFGSTDVGGGCFELEASDHTTYHRCDVDDGSTDGSTGFVGVPHDVYRLRETTIPSGWTRVATQSVTVPGTVDVSSPICDRCATVRLVNQNHVPIFDGCLSFPAGLTFYDDTESFPLDEDVPLGCQDLDGLVSVELPANPDGTPPFLGDTAGWPAVVRRSGIDVGMVWLTPSPTGATGIQEFTVADPARLVVHGVGEDGQPLPAPFDCGAPVLFARSDCVFEGVVGTQVQVGLPAAAGYVAPAGFTWTLSSLTDTRTVQWPRAQVTVHRVGASGRYCVVLTDTASVAAGDFQCSNATGGDIVLRAMSAGTYTLAEVSAPPGHQVAGAVTVTLVDGQAVNVDLVEHTALTVRLDDYFSAVPGGCFQLEASDHTLYGRCDGDDGANDGATGFVNVPDGSYRLRETTVPSGHVRIASRPVTVPGDVTVDGRKCTACLSVRMLDLNHNPISDACMNLAPGVDTIAGIPGGGDHVERPVGCEDLDGLISFGYQDFSYLSPGSPGFPATWPVVVRRSGVVVAANASVTLTPGSAIQELMIPDPVFPDLTVHLKGQSGFGSTDVGGGCFELEASDHTTYHRCDVDDGSTDGSTGFVGVPHDVYRLRETTIPSGWTRVATQSVTVPGTVDVSSPICDRCATVRLVNQNHVPIFDGCLSFPAGLTFYDDTESFPLDEDVPLGCQDLDGLVSVELPANPDGTPPFLGDTAGWPAVVRRSGIDVGMVWLTPSPTGDTGIQEFTVADP